jgi:hypothetical protein
MSDKKKFLLRLNEDLYSALEKWAAHDLRSVNAQIEFLLTDALRKSGRVNPQETANENRDTSDADPSTS